MTAALNIDDLFSAVTENEKYRTISPGLIRSIGESELQKRRNFKEAVKATRNKLHQVGGAYFDRPIDFAEWSAELDCLPADLQHPSVHAFCLQKMQSHASTRERLPLVKEFYTTVLQPLGQVRSIIDVACGLNPLALPWMPLAAGGAYLAGDIYADMTGFIDHFLKRMDIPGGAQVCNLVDGIPSEPAELALVLKTIPCLEQLEKNIALRLLDGLNAPNLLVTFPARSLSGRSKGMTAYYGERFEEMLAQRNWSLQRFEFLSELAFLVRR